jgi:hypothetical protein
MLPTAKNAAPVIAHRRKDSSVIVRNGGSARSTELYAFDRSAHPQQSEVDVAAHAAAHE